MSAYFHIKFIVFCVKMSVYFLKTWCKFCFLSHNINYVSNYF